MASRGAQPKEATPRPAAGQSEAEQSGAMNEKVQNQTWAVSSAGNFLGMWVSVLEKPLKAKPSLAGMLMSASCDQGHRVKSGNSQILNVLSHKVMPEFISGCSPPALNNKPELRLLRVSSCPGLSANAGAPGCGTCSVRTGQAPGKPGHAGLPLPCANRGTYLSFIPLAVFMIFTSSRSFHLLSPFSGFQTFFQVSPVSQPPQFETIWAGDW